MHPHTLYVEVCVGGGAVFWSKPNDPKIVEVLNDIDGELINFYRQLHRRGRMLTQVVNAMPYSRRVYNEIRSQNPKSPFKRAVRFWYLNRVSYGSSVLGQSYGVDTVTKRQVLYQNFLGNLDAIIERLRGVMFECIDFQNLIELYDRHYTCFYVDPPYYGVDCRYRGNFTQDDHARLAAVLRSVNGQWILSYNDCPYIRDLYAGYTIHRRDIRYTLRNPRSVAKGESRKTTGELLIGNR
jgi:DNA adenine methylase